jgi:hypothetical protein
MGVLAVGALASCEGFKGFPPVAGGSSDASASAFPACDTVEPYTIDGLFTGFTNETGPVAASTKPQSPYEWQSVPYVTGKYTRMYMDGCSEGATHWLFFLNDWHRNVDGPVADRCFNRFDFFDPDSGDAIEIRVHGDGAIDVLKNGVDASAGAIGAAGFASSPTVGEPHSIFEFKMNLPSPLPATTWTVGASDPCGPQPPPPPPPPPQPPPVPPLLQEYGCEDPSYLLDEPVMAHVSFAGGAPHTDVAPDAPIVMAFDKFDAVAGDRVVARGRRLGTTPGTVRVGDLPAQVLLWTDTRIVFVVPDGARTHIAGPDWDVPGPHFASPSRAN